MGGFIILEEIAEEEGPVLEEEAATAWEATIAEAQSLEHEAEALGHEIADEAESLSQEVESEGNAALEKLKDAFTEHEVGETTLSCDQQAENGASDAVKLQERAAELQKMREPWIADRGTTAVVRGQDPITGEVRDFISTEGTTMPLEWEGQLGPNEQFVEGEGHAEETILNSNETSGFDLTSGGTSRGICKDTCQPLLEDEGFTLEEAPEPSKPYVPRSQNTPFRMFYKK